MAPDDFQLYKLSTTTTQQRISVNGHSCDWDGYVSIRGPHKEVWGVHIYFMFS